MFSKDIINNIYENSQYFLDSHQRQIRLRIFSFQDIIYIFCIYAVMLKQEI